MSAPLVAGGKKKICTKCGKDVSGAPRMKDHDGKYWCVPCGEADRLHQIHSDAGICEGCGESFHKSQLLDIGGQHLCQRCRRVKFSRGGAGRSRGIIGSIKSLFGK